MYVTHTHKLPCRKSPLSCTCLAPSSTASHLGSAQPKPSNMEGGSEIRTCLNLSMELAVVSCLAPLPMNHGHRPHLMTAPPLPYRTHLEVSAAKQYVHLHPLPPLPLQQEAVHGIQLTMQAPLDSYLMHGTTVHSRYFLSTVKPALVNCGHCAKQPPAEVSLAAPSPIALNHCILLL